MNPPTSIKTRVDIDYQQLTTEKIRQQQANAAMHMHDSTATNIASDSQSSLANATIPNDQFNESETSAVSEQGTSSTVSDLIKCSKGSHRAQQIMSNIHQNVFKLQMGFPFLKEMHNKHSAWRSYYESFRRLRESVDLPWQKPVEELRERQLLCIQNKTSGSPFVGSRHLQGDLGGLVTVMPTTREIDEINPLSLHTHMPL